MSDVRSPEEAEYNLPPLYERVTMIFYVLAFGSVLALIASAIVLNVFGLFADGITPYEVIVCGWLTVMCGAIGLFVAADMKTTGGVLIKAGAIGGGILLTIIVLVLVGTGLRMLMGLL